MKSLAARFENPEVMCRYCYIIGKGGYCETGAVFQLFCGRFFSTHEHCDTGRSSSLILTVLSKLSTSCACIPPANHACSKHVSVAVCCPVQSVQQCSKEAGEKSTSFFTTVPTVFFLLKISQTLVQAFSSTHHCTKVPTACAS